MEKIDKISFEKYPSGTLFQNSQSLQRLAYLKGINDTLTQLRLEIQSKVPEDLPEFVDRMLKFIESYYEEV